MPAAGERERVLAEFQETVHRVMFGVKERRAWFVKRELARQEYEDGGLKLLDVVLRRTEGEGEGGDRMGRRGVEDGGGPA